ncbi:MAG TPA: uroporphyrinogen-III C-methyltransferase [Opitutaceae bacterium]|nr:uroporphyrinogen-III C-methyltransferase [Opitutaceae bacterium]
MPAGFVSFVGAGPGAADLITVRGRDIISRAETVLYDSLVSADLLEFAPDTAELVFVGKRAGRHSAMQAEINALLVQHAGAGRRVVRLKGGDPTLFGRLTEEIDVLNAAAIPYEIVPGVTAACAAAAAAGISLTNRSNASTAIFAPGHECAGKESGAEVDWAGLSQPNATLCLYMGVRALARVASQLMAHGLPPETPVLVVSDASLSTQRVRAGTLVDAAALSSAAEGYPSLVLIGQNARLPHLRAGVTEALANA